MIVQLNREKAKKCIRDYLVGSTFLEVILTLINEKDSHFYTFVTKDYDEQFLYDFEDAGKVFDCSSKDYTMSPFEEYSKFISSRVQEDSILFEDLMGVYEGNSGVEANVMPGASSLLALKQDYVDCEVSYPGGVKVNSADFLIRSSRDFQTIFYVLNCTKSTLISKLYILDKSEGRTFLADNLIAFAIQIYDQDSMLFWSKEEIDTQVEIPCPHAAL